jgi:hypothetical protein
MKALTSFIPAATAVLGVGCGPSWEGVFEGDAVSTFRCTDGSGDVQNVPEIRWTLEDLGESVTVAPRAGTCGAYTGRPEGNRLRMQPKNCPEFSAEGFLYRWTMSGGTLKLDGDNLIGELRFSYSVFFENGAPAGTCSDTATVDLIRVES